MKSLKGIIVGMLVIALVLQPMVFESSVEATINVSESNYKMSVLEVEPSRTFLLTTADLPANATLTQYSMKEFIAKRDDLIGKYDIIMFGGSASNYNYIGAASTKISKEYYSANDITNLKALQLKEYVTEGQMVAYNENLFKGATSTQQKTKMYTNFNDYYVNSGSYTNVVFENTDAKLKSAVSNYAKNIASYKTKAKLRPYLNVTSAPMAFDGKATSYEDTGTITYVFEAGSYGAETDKLTANLYFDIDGNGLYENDKDELMKSQTNLSSSNDLSMSLVIPESFTGLQAWKLEVINQTTGTQIYKSGNVAFKGINPIKLNVLQVVCNNSTFSLKDDLKDEAGNSLLNASLKDEYKITVDEISMSAFTNLYNTTGFSLINYKSPKNQLPYNMIIFGFADTYGGADISSQKIADDIKAFIATGQSVMFTHDNLTFNTSGWGANITKYFRDQIGQNIYSNGRTMPASYTYGFSDSRLDRAVSESNFTNSLTSSVSKFNDGLLTNYPYTLGDISVATTHFQYYQLDLENKDVVVWYTLKGGNNDKYDPQNDYYTYSIGNITYSGTGHSNLKTSNTYDERRLFVNTMIKAIRGSNIAPTVTIQGIIEGQNISKATTSQKFTVTAFDPDIKDVELNGRVYLDANGDKLYTDSEMIKEYKISNGTGLTNNLPSDVTANLGLIGATVTGSGIKVIVYDGSEFGKGAKGEKEVRFNYVNTPALSLNSSTKFGLVGDTIPFVTNLKLEKPASTLETSITNIGLSTKLYSGDVADGVQLNLANGSLDVTNYTSWNSTTNQLATTLASITNIGSTPTWSTQTINFNLVAKKAGIYNIQQRLAYYLTYYKMTGDVAPVKTVQVKKGSISFDLKDEFGSSATELIPAKLYKIKDAEGNTITKQLMYSMNINKRYNFGELDAEVLATGTYQLETTATSNYGSAISSPIVIDFTTPAKAIDLVLQSKPIKDLTWSHLGTVYNSNNMRYLNATGVGKEQILFTTTTSLKAIEIQLTESANIDLSNLVVKNTSGTTMSGFTYDAGTNKIVGQNSTGLYIGDYVATFDVKFPSGSTEGTVAALHMNPVVRLTGMNDAVVNYTSTTLGDLKFGYDTIAPVLTNKTLGMQLNETTNKVPMRIDLDGTGSNIISAKYQLGTGLSIANFATNGSVFTQYQVGGVDSPLPVFHPTGIVTIDNNKTYTVYAKDEAGNEATLSLPINVTIPGVI